MGRTYGLMVSLMIGGIYLNVRNFSLLVFALIFIPTLLTTLLVALLVVLVFKGPWIIGFMTGMMMNGFAPPAMLA